MTAIRMPRWTVAANITTDGIPWVGTSWEFFDDEKDANRCYMKHVKAGNVPTKRPFRLETDISHLGAAQQHSILERNYTHGKEEDQ